MVPGFVLQGLLQLAPNFKLALAKVLSERKKGDASNDASPFFFIKKITWHHSN